MRPMTLDGIGGSTVVTASTSLQEVDPGTPMAASSQYVVFVSSPQRELATERRAVLDFVEADPLLRKFFEVFLFENLPASGRRPDQTYLQQAEQAAIYVGLFGHEYGQWIPRESPQRSESLIEPPLRVGSA